MSAAGRRLAEALAMLMLLALASPGSAAEGDSSLFHFVSLEFPDRAQARRIADVDGDGKLDLSWVFNRVGDPDDYWLRTCLQEPLPHFSKCTVFDLPDEVRAFDLGNIDAGREAELVLLTSSGLRRSAFGSQGFAAALPTQAVDTLLIGTGDDAPLGLRFLFDLDADGRAEAVLPTGAGPSLHRFGEDGLEAGRTLESPARVRYVARRPGQALGFVAARDSSRALSAEASAVAIFVEDFDGDARRDIVAASDEGLRVFLQGADGDFARKPSLVIQRSILSDQEGQDSFAGETLSFADLNGDGAADLVAMKWGSTEDRTRMDRHLFYARPGLRYPEQADQVIRSESFFAEFEMCDLDANGRLDLVIPYFRLAPSQVFRAATQSELRVQLRLFLMRDDGRYSQDPGKSFAKVDRRIVLDYHLDVFGLIFGSAPRPHDGFEPLLQMCGDFNGDGYADLIFDNGNDELRFYWGDAQAGYSKSADLVVDYESSLTSDLADLNGDGKTDLLTYYGHESVRWKSATEAARSGRRPRNLRERQRREQAAAEPDAREPEPEPEPESRVKFLISR